MKKDEDTDMAAWPDCAKDGCTNKCCLALDSIYCFPHTPGNEHVKRLKIDAFHAEDLAEIIAREELV